jgi:hypothetical protein
LNGPAPMVSVGARSGSFFLSSPLVLNNLKRTLPMAFSRLVIPYSK